MTMQTRRFNSLGIAREDDAAKGTVVALSTGVTITASDGKLKPVVSYAMTDGLQGVAMEGTSKNVVDSSSVLSFSADVKSDWIGHILTGLLGTVSSANADGETLVREHTITVLNGGNLPAYSLFQIDAIQSQVATYGTVKKVTFKCAPNGLLTADVEMVGQKVEDGSGTAAHSSDYHFQGSHGTIKLAADVSSLTAAAGLSFASLELTIEREVIPVYGFTTTAHTDPTEPISFVGGKIMVSGTIVIPWEAVTYHDYVMAGTDKAMRITFINPTTIGNAEKPELAINIARVYFEETDRPDSPDEPDFETLKFSATYDLDDGTTKDIGIVLTNTEATTAYTEPA